MMRATHLIKFGKLSTIIDKALYHKEVMEAYRVFADAIAGGARPEAIIRDGKALTYAIDGYSSPMSDLDRMNVRRLINELSQ